MTTIQKEQAKAEAEKRLVQQEGIRRRLKEIFERKGVSRTSLTGSGNALQSKFTRQFSTADITCDVILTILNRFPDVDANWLIKGKGEMTGQVCNSIGSTNGDTVISESSIRQTACDSELRALLREQVEANRQLTECVRVLASGHANPHKS